MYVNVDRLEVEDVWLLGVSQDTQGDEDIIPDDKLVSFKLKLRYFKRLTCVRLNSRDTNANNTKLQKLGNTMDVNLRCISPTVVWKLERTKAVRDRGSLCAAS